jgi:hypothetical protein
MIAFDICLEGIGIGDRACEKIELLKDMGALLQINKMETENGSFRNYSNSLFQIYSYQFHIQEMK